MEKCSDEETGFFRRGASWEMRAVLLRGKLNYDVGGGFLE